MHRLGACGGSRRPRGRRLIGAVALLGVTVARAVPPLPIPETGWELVFGDGFEGTELKPIWAEAPFVDSLPATVADGILTVRSASANGHQWGYLATTGPRIEAEPSYPYAAAWQEGYVEARVRYTNDRWAHPAMWLFSMAKTEAWPGEDCSRLNAEWDIMENGIDVGDGSRPANDWVTSAIHRNTTDNTPDGYCGLPDVHQYASTPSRGVDLSSWHTWAGRWTAAELCTYVDDVLVHCLPTYDTTAQPMHLVLSIGYLGACTGCPPPPAEMEMQVDSVARVAAAMTTGRRHDPHLPAGQ